MRLHTPQGCANALHFSPFVAPSAAGTVPRAEKGHTLPSTLKGQPRKAPFSFRTCYYKNMSRFQERLDDFKKALSSLEESLQVVNPDDLQKDGIIQRFEFTFECAWKSLDQYMEEGGGSEYQKNVKVIFKEAYNRKIISEVDSYIEMTNARNKTSHEYNKDDSRTIYEKNCHSLRRVAAKHLYRTNQIAYMESTHNTSELLPSGLSTKHKKILEDVFKKSGKVHKVYVYGSRANGTHRERSDIDLGVLLFPDVSNPEYEISELNDALAESNIPFLTSIVNDAEQHSKKEGDFAFEYHKNKKCIFTFEKDSTFSV